MGCRERTRAQIRIPGTRPAGVYTAGTAQRWVNVEGYMPGKQVVILGSGDIGMIMARRLTFEGAKVERVLEVMPYLTGLSRNYVQCLLDFDIPLQLRHTVKRIIGRERVEAVEAVAVDEQWQTIPGTEEIIPCDTLLLGGLIPENELSRKPVSASTRSQVAPSSIRGTRPARRGSLLPATSSMSMIWWTGSPRRATWPGRAARYALGNAAPTGKAVPTVAGDNVRYVVPHTVDPVALTEGEVRLQMRVTRPLEQAVRIEVLDGEIAIAHQGARYARPGEMVNITLRQRDYDKVRAPISYGQRDPALADER